MLVHAYLSQLNRQNKASLFLRLTKLGVTKMAATTGKKIPKEKEKKKRKIILYIQCLREHRRNLNSLWYYELRNPLCKKIKRKAWPYEVRTNHTNAML